MDKKSYKQYATKSAKKSPLFKDMLMAFLFGGMICVIGNALGDLYRYWGLSDKLSSLLVSVTLIFIACLLTGIGVFKDIARIAGAGTLVPITGFANATMSPALDSKNEGLVLGVGAKLFLVSGAVILYGVFFSTIYGVIYYFFCK